MFLETLRGIYTNHAIVIIGTCTLILKKVGLFPAGTQHQNDVVSTSMRRDHVASTLIRRHFNVVCLLCWVVKRIKVLTALVGRLSLNVGRENGPERRRRLFHLILNFL